MKTELEKAYERWLSKKELEDSPKNRALWEEGRKSFLADYRPLKSWTIDHGQIIKVKFK